MAALLRKLFVCVLFCAGALQTKADILFQDNFESGQLNWLDVRSTESGRIRVTSEFEPFEGSKHLVFDDSVTDAIYSLNQATFSVNLLNRKDVVLTFMAKSLNDEPDQLDVVSISYDRGEHWNSVRTLYDLGTNWQQISVQLYPIPWQGMFFTSDVRIRFSQYDNSSAPIDGIAIDNVVVAGSVDQRAVLEMPRNVTEGAGPYTGLILTSVATNQPYDLNLRYDPPLTGPATVTIPAGQTSAAFQFSALDDSDLNLTRYGYVTVSGPGIFESYSLVYVQDDETATLSLDVPSTLQEGSPAPKTGRVRISKPASVPVYISLNLEPSSEISIEGWAEIPAGQTERQFNISAYDDDRIDGTVEVMMTATVEGLTPATAKISVEDNERRLLSFVVPSYLPEGSSTNIILNLSGRLSAPLTVNLLGDGKVTIPSAITVPAGEIQAVIPILVPDNALGDGTRVSELAASANGFISTNTAITIRDNEKAAYLFTQSPDLVSGNGPYEVAIVAADIEGNVIESVSANETLNLSLVLPDGSTLPVTPSSVTLFKGRWSGSVTFPETASAPLRLRVSGASGITGESALIDLSRKLEITASDLIWDSQRKVIYAAIPSFVGPGANTVVAIDPTSGNVTGSISIPGNPRQLAITSGQEYLYVSQDANGTISRIDLNTFSTNLIFKLGITNFADFYAEDIATVVGNPNLLVVSRYFKSGSPRHAGVAAYENGVMKSATTQPHTGSNLIEPSADTNIFFGLNTETTESGFRRLELDANGIRELEVKPSLLWTMKSDGDIVVGYSGVMMNGAEMQTLGSFNTYGDPFPELAVNRVYFLEATMSWNGQYFVGAFEPGTFQLVREVRAPFPVTNPSTLIRWGTNGLAFRAQEGVFLLSGSLVPSFPAADLAVSVASSPTTGVVGQPITYTAVVTNSGPNAAVDVVLNLAVSTNQQILKATANAGIVLQQTNNLVSGRIASLASGASVSVSVTSSPLFAGIVSLQASAVSSSVDPVVANNYATNALAVGYQSGPNSVNTLLIRANKMVADELRDLLWLSIPATDNTNGSVVAVNPLNGNVSPAISFIGRPGALAISKNGRYLYVALENRPEIQRINLETRVADLRIQLGSSTEKGPYYAEDLCVLDGDGTSIIVSRRNGSYSPRHEGVVVFDGAVQRPTVAMSFLGSNQIEPSAVSNVFVGYDTESTEAALRTLVVNPNGVSIERVVANIFGGSFMDIRSGGDLLLSTAGMLAQISTLTLKTNFNVRGFPALDGANHRAFLLSTSQLRAYDTTSFEFIGAMPISGVNWENDILDFCRWGEDGFAYLTTYGQLVVIRWDLPFPNAGPVLVLSGRGSGGEINLEFTHQFQPGTPVFKLFGTSDFVSWTELGAPAVTEELLETYSQNGINFKRVRFSIDPESTGARFFRVGRAVQ